MRAGRKHPREKASPLLYSINFRLRRAEAAAAENGRASNSGSGGLLSLQMETEPSGKPDRPEPPWHRVLVPQRMSSREYPETSTEPD